HSRLQLALELVQKAPIGVFGDDLLRSRFDEADFAQPQRIEADCVLGVVFAPLVVRNIAQCLERVVVARRVTAFDKLLRGTGWLRGAKICSLQVGSDHTLGGDRISPHVFRGCRPAYSRNTVTTGDPMRY